MGGEDEVIVSFLELLLQFLGQHRPAPGTIQDVAVQVEASADLGHAVSEVALRYDERPLPPSQGVDQGHLHGQRARAGDDEGLSGFGEDDRLQVGEGRLEFLGQRRTDMGDCGPGQGLKDPRLDRARSRNHQQFFGVHGTALNVLFYSDSLNKSRENWYHRPL